MEGQNLYRPPQADLTRPPATAAAGITPRMIELLSKTRPWVLFIAILGLIATGLLVVAGLGMAAMMAVTGGSAQAAGMGIGMGLLYLLFAVIYFFPCWFLLKYAGAIRKLVDGGGGPAMEEALDRQYAFWRLVGILTVVTMVIYVIILIGAVVMGVLAR